MTREEVFADFVSRFDRGLSRTPASAAEIDAAAVALGTAWPAAYREFLLTHGGASTPGLLTLVANEDNDEAALDVQELESVGRLVQMNEDAWIEGMPVTLVAIGRDSLQNFFCFPRQNREVDDLPVMHYDRDFDAATEAAESFVSLLRSFLRFPSL